MIRGGVRRPEMKEVLLHINNAIEVLRRSNGSPGVISLLEGVHANLMRETFRALSSDWTLGLDEPRPSAKYGMTMMDDPRYQHGLSK
jgi:hypothetical protein